MALAQEKSLNILYGAPPPYLWSRPLSIQHKENEVLDVIFLKS